MNKQNIRILFFSDTHLGFDYPIKPRVSRRRRGQEFFDNYLKVLSFAMENKVDFMIHGGDFFFRSKIPQKIVDLAYQALYECANKGMPIFIVPGNHERSKLPASLFLGHPNIHIFDQPRTFIIEKQNGSISITGFPFQRKNIRSRFQSVLADTEFHQQSADTKLLCMHQAVEGAQVGVSNYTFKNSDDVIRMNDLPDDCAAILCGHIHRKQVLLKRTDNKGSNIPVIYPGSTQRTSFAERQEEKGFFVIDLINNEKNSWRVYNLDFKPLPSRPMVDIYIGDTIKKDNLKPFLLSKLSNIDQDAIVRLKCNGSLDEQVHAILTSHYLRENFNYSLNFQFSQSFYVSKK